MNSAPQTRPFLAVLMLLSLAAALLIVALPRVEAEMIDRVVAEVNDDVITLSEVEAEGRMLFQKIVRETPAAERDTALSQARRDVLAGLIDKTLIIQEAAKQNITVSEQEVDEAVNQVLEGNNISRETLVQQLEQSGLDEATYRSNLRAQILQNKLFTRDVRSKIVITEDMMLDAYDTIYTRRVKEGSYYLLQIGISWDGTGQISGAGTDETRRKEEARRLAERVHKLARSGQDFRELARKFSDLPSASEGGDIGVFEEDELARYMKEAITGLKPGEVSAVVETPVGFQFFKLLSSNEGGIVMQTPYESVKEEIRERIFRETMKNEYEDWITSLREKAYIRVML